MMDSEILVNGDHDDDSALDLLETLLSGSETNETKHNFNESISHTEDGTKEIPDIKKLTTSIHSGDTDSSEDEDNRYFESQKYNECGRNIKKIINDNENSGKLSSLFLGDPKTKVKEVTWKSKVSMTSVKSCSIQQKLDVYSDPVFGIRMINPLVTSRQLQEKMIGRTPVTMTSIKQHIANGSTESDWVIAGVVVQKSPIRTSQKGSQYCIWKISDLKGDLKTVSVFFFRNSHKTLWKTAIGTVIGILNPRIMDDSKDCDEATIAVDNAQKVMILGVSKDYGLCKAKKKNGEACTAFVNTNKCSYCIYHVQQEYKKCSRRSELQSPGLGKSSLSALRNKVLGKNEVFYGGQSFMAVPAVTNRKQVAKDEQKLQDLRQTTIPTSYFVKRQEASQQNNLRDKKLLSTLAGVLNPKPEKTDNTLRDTTSTFNRQPQLSKGVAIDLSSPVNKFLVNRAKLSAMEWVKKNGKFDKSNPNEVRRKCGLKKRSPERTSPEERAKKILKMSNEKKKEKVEEPKQTSKTGLSSKFLELMATKSKHLDLIEASDANAQDEYFNLLEKKEKMEEKMLNTYKVPCKAVHCVKCKYTAFSASDLCKNERHPLKVTDSFKRFFCCKNCKNRTVTLELIPLLSCKQCGGSHWERAPMMKERKGNLHIQPLSIRGGEEKFFGSLQDNGNLDLLVPE